MLNKVLRFSLLFFFFVSSFGCSLDSKTGIWNDKKRNKTKTENSKLKKLTDGKNKLYVETNPELRIDLNSEPKINSNWMMSGLNYSNSLNHLKFEGNINKFSKYKIKKITYKANQDSSLILGKNYFVTVDNEGTILRFSGKKYIWRIFFRKRDRIV